MSDRAIVEARPNAPETAPHLREVHDAAKRELRRARTRALGLFVAAYVIAIVGFVLVALMTPPGDWWSAAASSPSWRCSPCWRRSTG